MLGLAIPEPPTCLEIGGRKAAILTLVGDMLKGVIPVAVAILLQQSTMTVGLVALAAFTGHLWPIFFQFKGGKGVATFYGVIYVMNWQLGLFATVTLAVNHCTVSYFKFIGFNHCHCGADLCLQLFPRTGRLFNHYLCPTDRSASSKH